MDGWMAGGLLHGWDGQKQRTTNSESYGARPEKHTAQFLAARSTNLLLHSFVIVAIALSAFRLRFLGSVFGFPVYFVVACALSSPSALRRFVLLGLFWHSAPEGCVLGSPGSPCVLLERLSRRERAKTCWQG